MKEIVEIKKKNFQKSQAHTVSQAISTLKVFVIFLSFKCLQIVEKKQFSFCKFR